MEKMRKLVKEENIKKLNARLDLEGVKYIQQEKAKLYAKTLYYYLYKAYENENLVPTKRQYLILQQNILTKEEIKQMDISRNIEDYSIELF